MTAGWLAALVAVASCGTPVRPAPPRPPSRFAPGFARLAVAIVDVGAQADPRSRRQVITLTLTDGAGAEHVLHRRFVDGTCAIDAARGRRDDLEADAALLVVIDCPHAVPTPVRLTAVLDRGALRVIAPEGEQEFATPSPFDVVAGEPPE